MIPGTSRAGLPGGVVRLLPPPWLPESLWPFDTYSCEIDGTSIAFVDVGEGPTLLFVHTGLWSFIWRDLIVRLSERYRCICLDAPSTGRSGGPARGAVRLESSVRAVTGLIDRLGLSELGLVVHDLGGLSGVVGAARSAATVTGIVGINAFAWRPGGRALRSLLRILGSRVAREIDVVTGVIPRVTATSFGVGRLMDGPSRKAFRVPLGSQGIRAFHNYLHDALRCDGLHVEASRALAGRFARLPVMTIFGERNDPFRFQQEWRRRFLDAQQLVIRGGNHFPMCDSPSFVAAAIDAWHIAKRVR